MQGRWFFGTSLPSSWSAGFPNKITIPCPINWSLSLLACLRMNSIRLELPRRRKCEQRKKNLKSLMMTWTLVFLTKSLL
uniref:Uncharacterized protein n=2 Tax=Sus scrofa TaxID=9823 RepID=A0A8D2C546_PIG